MISGFTFDLLLQLKHLSGCFEDGPGLHFRDFRIRNSKAAAAMAKHWVFFMQSVYTLGDYVDRYT